MFDDRDPCLWLDALNAEQRAAATLRGRPAADPRRRRHRQDDDAVRPRGVAAGEGVPAERILLLTFTRRAAREMVERARALAERVAPDARPRRRRHVPFGRPPDGAPARLLARPRLRASACSTPATPPTCSTSCARSTATRASRRRFPRAQTMLDIYSRTVNAQTPLRGGAGRVVPVVRGAPRRARRDVPRLRRAQARARACSTSTTCCSTGARWRPTR